MSPLEVTSEQVVRLGYVLWPGSRVHLLMQLLSHMGGEGWLWPGRGARPDW